MDVYWGMEYGKVFWGYVFLMFIWPMVIFRNHLRGKSKTYGFGFCVTVQIIIINTVVLTLGLFHILNRIIVALFFYGTFLLAIWRSVSLRRGQQFSCLKQTVLRQIRKLWSDVYLSLGEYSLLLSVIIFGIIYFSYGSFQIHTYGCYDLITHHGWINRMIGGEIFPDGIYPAAMHSFIYCLYALFDIRIYNIMLYLQCIHLMVFLLSAYCLFREIFSWRYTPIFVISLFLIINVNNHHGMYRLPVTLPMEFGLHTQFLCALFLIRYLRNAKCIFKKERTSKFFWSTDLILFIMSLAATLSTHYYVTLMAFILCASFALFSIRKVINVKYLIPLIISVFMGCAIAILPVAGALASGIPFQRSINWGVKVINSNDKNSTAVLETETGEVKSVSGVLDPTSEDWIILEKLPDTAQHIIKGIIKVENLIKITYKFGYQGTFKQVRGRRIFGITIGVILICFMGRVFSCKYINKISSLYMPVVLISFLSMLIYAAYASPELGLPVIIPNHRFCPEGFLMIFAVMMMPADILFTLSARYYKEYIMQKASYIFVVGLYIAINQLGIFHEYLYYSLNRYEAAVLVTNDIINEFVPGSYTIVSPIEEKPQIELFGEHEEILKFLKNCNTEKYSLSTEYVFLYIEKRPIEYFQEYYFNGPSWLARSRDMEIVATEISKEAAQEELPEYLSDNWELYINLRTIVESKIYEWCQDFLQKHPSELNVYYEDENFVCYYFKQDVDKPYNLAGE